MGPEDGDAQFIICRGSIGAMRKNLGIHVDVPASGAHAVVTDARGVEWELFGTDPFAMTMRRPRPTGERAAWIDAQNARVSSGWFSKDRQFLRRLAAVELMEIASRLARAPRPGAGRALRRKLQIIGEVRWALTTRTGADMGEMRAQLQAAGVPVGQPNRRFNRPAHMEELLVLCARDLRAHVSDRLQSIVYPIARGGELRNACHGALDAA